MRSLNLCVAVVAVCMTCAANLNVSTNGVKVSEAFGYDAEDSTAYLQAALDSGLTQIIVDRQSGPWYTLPLKGRSNQEIIFEDGVELCAKRGAFESKGASLLTFVAASNVTIRGNGTLRMWREDYIQAPYKPSEHRHGLALRGCSDVCLERIRIVDTGGDGVYVGTSGPFELDAPCRNVVIRDVICDRNHRQGISVISVVGLLVERCVLSNTRGTPPEAGIDFEPNFAQNELTDCVIRDCTFANNVGSGCEIVVCALNVTSKPISIAIEKCQFEGNLVGFKYLEGNKDFLKPCFAGRVDVRQCEFYRTKKNAVWVRRKPFTSGTISFNRCNLRDCCSDVPGIPDIAFFATGHAQYTPDDFELRDVAIRQGRKRDWLLPSFVKTYCGTPSRISGNVSISVADGRTEDIVLDEYWRRIHYPFKSDFFDAALSSPRFYPMDTKVVDSKPSQPVSLSFIPVRGGGRYVFWSGETVKVSFSCVQHRIGRRHPAQGKRLKIFPLESGSVIADVVLPETFDEFSFDTEIPVPGFYRMEVDSLQGNGFCLKSSTVPVALDVRVKPQQIVEGKGDLWAWLPHGARLRFEGVGDGLENFASAIYSPSGVPMEMKATNFDALRYMTPDNAESGLWRISITSPTHGVLEDFNLGISGVHGFLFLSSDKYWQSTIPQP